MTHNFIITNCVKPSAEAYYVYSFIYKKAHYQYAFCIQNDCKLDEQLWSVTSTTRKKIANRPLLDDLHLATETINRLRVPLPRKIEVKNGEIFF